MWKFGLKWAYVARYGFILQLCDTGSFSTTPDPQKIVVGRSQNGTGMYTKMCLRPMPKYMYTKICGRASRGLLRLICCWYPPWPQCRLGWAVWKFGLKLVLMARCGLIGKVGKTQLYAQYHFLTLRFVAALKQEAAAAEANVQVRQ